MKGSGTHFEQEPHGHDNQGDMEIIGLVRIQRREETAHFSSLTRRRDLADTCHHIQII